MEASEFYEGKIKALIDIKHAMCRDIDADVMTVQTAWLYLYVNIRDY